MSGVGSPGSSKIFLRTLLRDWRRVTCVRVHTNNRVYAPTCLDTEKVNFYREISFRTVVRVKGVGDPTVTSKSITKIEISTEPPKLFTRSSIFFNKIFLI